jgi:hypothetical protein
MSEQSNIMDHASAFEAMCEDKKPEEKVFQQRDLLIFDLDSYRYRVNWHFRQLTMAEEAEHRYIKKCADYKEPIDPEFQAFFERELQEAKKNMYFYVGNFKETMEFLTDFCNRNKIDCPNSLEDLDDEVKDFIASRTPPHSGRGHD